MRAAVLGLACSLLLLATPGADARPGGMEELHVTVGGRQRSFHLHVPAGRARSEAKALVVALHGGGSNGTSMARFSALNEKADEEGFLVAYPDGSGRLSKVLTWNSGTCCGYARKHEVDDVAFIAHVIDDLVATRGVDPRRVYVTGMSNGAMMAYRVAAELPDRIAAVAAVAGTLDVAPSALRGAVPVVHFHGTDDQHVPFEGGHGPKSAPGNVHRSVDETIRAWVAANGASARPEVHTMPDLADDGTKVTRHVHASASDPGAVVLYRIVGGGHTWPGRTRLERLLGRATLDISANDLLWEFFASHPKTARPGRPAAPPPAP
jgi:polyhydroxybutyrate depolymerase